MKSSIRSLAATALLSSLLASNAVPTTAAPSFDCKAAKADVEKFICRSEKLSALDQQIADAYKAALGRLADDPAAVALLREAQRQFVEQRDEGFDLDSFEDYLKGQRDFLLSIAGERKGFLGDWTNSNGSVLSGPMLGGAVSIWKRKNGKFYVAAETMKCQWGSWGESDNFSNARMKGAALVLGDPGGWTLRLTRRGRLLVLEEIEPKAAGKSGGNNQEVPAKDYCHAAGGSYLEGTYFAVTGPKLSSGDAIKLEQ